MLPPEFNFGDENSFHQIFLWMGDTLICLTSTYLEQRNFKKPCVKWFITSHGCWKLLLIYHLLWMYICMIKLVALLGIIKGLETSKKESYTNSTSEKNILSTIFIHSTKVWILHHFISVQKYLFLIKILQFAFMFLTWFMRIIFVHAYKFIWIYG